MITEDYVSFEVAKLLKEKGFNEPVSELNRLLFKEGEKPILKITHQKAMKWLREVHNINITIVSVWNQKRFEYQVFVVTPKNAKHCYVDSKLYVGYEQACETAIKYCLENLI